LAVNLADVAAEQYIGVTGSMVIVCCL